MAETTLMKVVVGYLDEAQEILSRDSSYETGVAAKRKLTQARDLLLNPTPAQRRDGWPAARAAYDRRIHGLHIEIFNRGVDPGEGPWYCLD